MNQEQRLSQKQSQSQKLAMNQRLQQSIQILHYNMEELYEYIKVKSLENPLIDFQNGFKIDTLYNSINKKNTEEQTNYLNQLPDNHATLFESLIDQIHLNYRDTYLRSLMLFLADYIDDNGYLTIDLEQAKKKKDAESIQMLDALTLIQQLDPAGIGARNLKECLLLQIERDNYSPNLAYIIVEEEFDHLANRKWAHIKKKYGISLEEVQLIFDYIQKLTPSPGNVFGSVIENYVVPELRVKQADTKITLVSNRIGASMIHFQQSYFDQMNATEDKEVQNYMQEKKKEVEWLQQAISQRGVTVFNVGNEILKRQLNFFTDPKRPLSPMTLKEIASALSIHESTVSRAVNGKYLETDFGIFELKSFFSTKISTADKSNLISSSNVKEELRQVIQNENKAKPLSDQKLADYLKEKNISIARRTVSKYREELGIASASKRKRYDCD